MKDSDVITKLEKRLTISRPERTAQCREAMETILRGLKENGVPIDDEEKLLGLMAHCYAMVNRVLDQEAVFEIDEELRRQVPEKFRKIAKACLAPLESTLPILNEDSEVFLISIHVQGLMESEEQKCQNH